MCVVLHLIYARIALLFNRMTTPAALEYCRLTVILIFMKIIATISVLIAHLPVYTYTHVHVSRYSC